MQASVTRVHVHTTTSTTAVLCMGLNLCNLFATSTLLCTVCTTTTHYKWCIEKTEVWQTFGFLAPGSILRAFSVFGLSPVFFQLFLDRGCGPGDIETLGQ